MQRVHPPRPGLPWPSAVDRLRSCGLLPVDYGRPKKTERKRQQQQQTRRRPKVQAGMAWWPRGRCPSSVALWACTGTIPGCCNWIGPVSTRWMRSRHSSGRWQSRWSMASHRVWYGPTQPDSSCAASEGDAGAEHCKSPASNGCRKLGEKRQ